jgi:hypothetical protein
MRQQVFFYSCLIPYASYLKEKPPVPRYVGTGGGLEPDAYIRPLLSIRHRIEGDKPQSSGATKSLHTVRNLQLIVDISKMEVHSALAYIEHIGNFFTGFAFNNEGQNLDFTFR